MNKNKIINIFGIVFLNGGCLLLFTLLFFFSWTMVKFDLVMVPNPDFLDIFSSYMLAVLQFSVCIGCVAMAPLVIIAALKEFKMIKETHRGE